MNVARPYLSPLAAVSFVSVVAASEVVVVLFHKFLMLWTVLFTVLAQLSASFIPAGAFRFPRHDCRLLYGIKKATREIPYGFVHIHFRHLNNITYSRWTSTDFDGFLF